MNDRKRVLIAPLDWGLGHATRCIPIIHNLVNAGFEVLIAADGPIKKLLELEFPTLQFVQLEGYRVKYGPSRRSLWLGLVVQMPRIIKKIKAENRWLRKFASMQNIDVIISDNRYGLYHPGLHSVFITHQLSIKTPFLHGVLQFLTHRLINHFDECWIPDFKEEPNLSGTLSHSKKLPSIPLKYLGALSRFKPDPTLVSNENKILVLLSGPEPQRTLLENIVLHQLHDVQQHLVMIRGLPGEAKTLPPSGNVTFFNHLPANELEREIQTAAYVIARTGYSTIMDLIGLKKKSILIPTPGQTEQEYLATHLTSHNLALCIPQERFILKEALNQAIAFPYKSFDNTSRHLLSTAIDSLKSKN